MNINGNKFTIGADPEIFMGKDGEFKSAHATIPGSKYEPYLVNKGAVQVDGMAMEFNIDPAESLKEFEDNLSTVQDILKGMIGDNEFLEDVSVMFDKDFTKTVPDYNLVLGCEADYNGWTLQDNPEPNGDQFMRTAGGHVHIGGFTSEDPFNPVHFRKCARLARILDETLGVYSLMWDGDDKRRSMYGQAGCFRPKPYGMEYRTLSNAWIFKKPLVHFVYKSVEKALTAMFTTDYEPDESVREIINTSNRSSNFFKGMDAGVFIQ